MYLKYVMRERTNSMRKENVNFLPLKNSVLLSHFKVCHHCLLSSFIPSLLFSLVLLISPLLSVKVRKEYYGLCHVQWYSNLKDDKYNL